MHAASVPVWHACDHLRGGKRMPLTAAGTGSLPRVIYLGAAFHKDLLFNEKSSWLLDLWLCQSCCAPQGMSSSCSHASWPGQMLAGPSSLCTFPAAVHFYAYAQKSWPLPRRTRAPDIWPSPAQRGSPARACLRLSAALLCAQEDAVRDARLPSLCTRKLLPEHCPAVCAGRRCAGRWTTRTWRWSNALA